MADAISRRPQVNGILETSLYVERRCERSQPTPKGASFYNAVTSTMINKCDKLSVLNNLN
jgi:hypothetical protein